MGCAWLRAMGGRAGLRGGVAVVGLLGLLMAAPGRAHAQAAAGAARPTPTPALDRPPSDGPVQVTVSMTIVDFIHVDSRDEAFEVRAFTIMRWHDPRLADPTATAERQFRPDDVWIPRLVYWNGLDNWNTLVESNVHVQPDGSAWKRRDFVAKFSSEMNLRWFPFDRQTLKIGMHALDHDASELQFVVDREATRILDFAFLPDWTINKAHFTVRVDSAPEMEVGQRYSTLWLEIPVKRRWEFYVYRVLMPITFLVLASWSIFWFDLAILDAQISTVMAIFLSLVLFNFSMDFSQPKFKYLTMLERYALVCNGATFSTLLAATALHCLWRQQRCDLARLWQRRVRWIFPIIFVAMAIASQYVP